jgi:hypothetical protein
MDNRVRGICSELLAQVNTTIDKQGAQIKTFLLGLEQCNARVSEVNSQYKRDLKLKDVVKNLSQQIASLVSSSVALIYAGARPGQRCKECCG